MKAIQAHIPSMTSLPSLPSLVSGMSRNSRIAVVIAVATGVLALIAVIARYIQSRKGSSSPLATPPLSGATPPPATSVPKPAPQVRNKLAARAALARAAALALASTVPLAPSATAAPTVTRPADMDRIRALEKLVETQAGRIADSVPHVAAVTGGLAAPASAVTSPEEVLEVAVSYPEHYVIRNIHISPDNNSIAIHIDPDWTMAQAIPEIQKQIKKESGREALRAINQFSPIEFFDIPEEIKSDNFLAIVESFRARNGFFTVVLPDRAAAQARA